jgi:hypothetical protein
VLTNVLISLSVAIAALALLDIFLNDSQKARISDVTTRMWSWLDDMSKLSFLDLLRQRLIQWWISILAATATFVGSEWLMQEMFNAASDVFLMNLILLIVFTWLGPKLMTFTLAPDGVLLILIRIIAVLAAYLAIVTAIYLGVQTVTDGTPGIHGIPSNIGIVIAVMFASFFCLLTVFFMIVAPLIFIFVARILLATAELTVRRIVEYPKGPILAGSALFGCIVALMKAFGVKG